MPRRNVPFGRTSSHFTHIANNLMAVLNDIKGAAAPAKILWVSCRLNKTGEQAPSPVFVGWVEDNEAIDIRVRKGCPYPPIDMRFGDTHPSALYSECLRTPLGTMVSRNWAQQRPDSTSQRLGETCYGEKFRRSMPIKLGNRYIGTVNAGFLADPTATDGQIKQKLEDWAQKTSSQLVTYIDQNLNVGGIAHP